MGGFWKEEVQLIHQTGERHLWRVFWPSADDPNQTKQKQFLRTLGKDEQWPAPYVAPKAPEPPKPRSTDPNVLANINASDLNVTEKRIVSSHLSAWSITGGGERDKVIAKAGELGVNVSDYRGFTRSTDELLTSIADKLRERQL